MQVMIKGIVAIGLLGITCLAMAASPAPNPSESRKGNACQARSYQSVSLNYTIPLRSGLDIGMAFKQKQDQIKQLAQKYHFGNFKLISQFAQVEKGAGKDHSTLNVGFSFEMDVDYAAITALSRDAAADTLDVAIQTENCEAGH